MSTLPQEHWQTHRVEHVEDAAVIRNQGSVEAFDQKVTCCLGQ
jgi:hypothetical protein